MEPKITRGERKGFAGQTWREALVLPASGTGFGVLCLGALLAPKAAMEALM